LGDRQVDLFAGFTDEGLGLLYEGEKAAIKLALALGGDLLLMDDRQGVLTARRKGFAVIGTIGILDQAAESGMIDLPAAINRLRKTNFRRSKALLDALLKKHAQEHSGV
jgi:predicted nucleic acid-binding protein